MSRKFKRKGKIKFTMIESYVSNSAAWRALTPIERNAYFEVKKRYDGANNGRIGLGCRELAAELNMSRNTANRALESLGRYGFIAVSKRSAFHVKNRLATEWRLTEYRCDVTGDLPTKEFVRWQPTEKPQSHPRDTQSHPRDAALPKMTDFIGHSPTHGTVKPEIVISQSHPRDTYRSTIPSELEDEAVSVGELAQRATQSAVASKLSGPRSPSRKPLQAGTIK